MSFYPEDVRQLRADLEATQRLNADLTKLLLCHVEKGAANVSVMLAPETVHRDDFEKHMERATEMAARQLVYFLERNLEERHQLYRQIAELKLSTSPWDWSPRRFYESDKKTPP